MSIFTSRKIQEAEYFIKKNYYRFDQKTKSEIENAMIESLVGSLGDKHSTYFPPKEAQSFSDVLRGDFEWIWAVIDEHYKGIIIRKIFSSSPAEKAWLEAGDILTHIDGISIVWMTSEQAVKKIRWPKLSKAVIAYLHGERDEEKKVEVIRDTIIIPSTQEKMLSGSIWYIEIAFFWEHTKKEFETSLENVTQSWAKWVVLDFRNNGGGYLDASVELLSMVLPENLTAVITKENNIKNNSVYTTKIQKINNIKIPIVIIINNLSASATEIFAWAIQDYDRWVIVWEKSYGKGSVQEPFIMEDGSMMKLTIGRWYTPKEKNIDADGITPDILIPIFESDFSKKYDRQLEWAKKVMDALIKDNNEVKNTRNTAKKIDFLIP